MDIKAAGNATPSPRTNCPNSRVWEKVGIIIIHSCAFTGANTRTIPGSAGTSGNRPR